jgi:predicted DNA-binding transcriptional regulator YafY
MYNPTTRLLTILDLLQSRGEMNGHALAQALEVEERSIRRYIMMLRDIGIPIEGERGRHGGYSLRPGFRLPPLMFNTQEIAAVVMGLMLMREFGSAGPAIESAAAKIDRVLPVELRRTTDALRQSLTLDDLRIRAGAVSSERLITFSVAVYERKCLMITYVNAAGEATARMIAPYGLVLHAKTWYIPAYCYLRDDMRVFQLDRVQAVSSGEQTFIRPADFDSRQFVLTSLARIPGTYAFEVVFHAPLATVQECITPGMALLVSEGANTLMRCYSDDPHWLARYLARIELPFTVRETDELRDALRTLAGDLLDSARDNQS